MAHDGLRRVVVTGMGAVTPVGLGVESTWQSLLAGRSGVRRIETFDASTFPVRIAGQVPDGGGGSEMAPLGAPTSRAGRFGMAAAAEALEDAELSDDYEAQRRAVVLGGSGGRLELQDVVDIWYRRHVSHGTDLFAQDPIEVVRRDQGTVVSGIAAMAGARGPVQGISTACAASMHALGEAMRLVQEDYVDMALAGGCEALTTWLDVLGFALLGALATGYEDNPTAASRPFARDRAGFVLGEGAVVLVLEERLAALARGAHIYGELSGYGSSLNAYRMTDPPPDGAGPSIAMANALSDSGLAPDQIGYVCAHGTGTPGNDRSETAAIRTVFGDHAGELLVSSPKSMTGHLTAAAGALNVLVCLLAIRDSIVPPTINLHEPDPQLGLDYVALEPRRRVLEACLTNAFAFGGTNGAIVVTAA